MSSTVKTVAHVHTQDIDPSATKWLHGDTAQFTHRHFRVHEGHPILSQNSAFLKLTINGGSTRTNVERYQPQPSV